ncbi:MAG: hypothetical protein V1921_09165 [Candidatus Altiarchaeota archaeon]
MAEVVIRKLEYIRGVPVELLDDAIAAGELRRGKTVGLYVVSKDDRSNDAHLELLLAEEGQEKLIQDGQILSIDSNSDYYTMDDGWESYAGKVEDRAETSKQEDAGKQSKWTFRPTARPF